MSLVSFSLNSFSSWIKSPELAFELSKKITSELPLVDGYEVYLPWGEVSNYSSLLSSRINKLPQNYSLLTAEAQEYILSLPVLSFHLDAAKLISKEQAQALGKEISSIHKALPQSYFVIHPDECDLEILDILSRQINKEGILTAENMDFRKKNYHSLKEFGELLRKIPNLYATFDVCHWFETVSDESVVDLNYFLTEFRSRIRAVHVSVPESKYGGYLISEPTSHYLCTASQSRWVAVIPSIIRCLPEAVLVMEGFSPAACSELITQEMLTLEIWSRNKVYQEKPQVI